MATKNPQNIAYPAAGSRVRQRGAERLDPHVIVLFGATGDLAKRKLIPGLAYLDQSALAPSIRVVGTSLEDLTDDEFRSLARAAVDSFGSHRPTDDQWASFASKISYIPQSAGPEALAAAVESAETELGALEKTRARRLHYLSVPPRAAQDVITTLNDAKLVERSGVGMEKPFGTTLGGGTP